MFSNMSNEEYFRIHNTLPADRIVELLDECAAKVDRDDVPFGEVLAQLPDEDFTNKIEERLQSLAKRLRGDNRAELLSIIAELSELAQAQAQATEYACEIVSNFKSNTN